jgi:hypothetical protein
MQPSGGMAVRDCDGFDLLIGDWVKLVHNEYKGGNKFQAGQPAKITDVIMDNCGIQAEVTLHQTTILVPPTRLQFYKGKDGAARRLKAAMAAAVASGKAICPVCATELQWFGGGDNWCPKCCANMQYMRVK